MLLQQGLINADPMQVHGVSTMQKYHLQKQINN